MSCPSTQRTVRRFVCVLMGAMLGAAALTGCGDSDQSVLNRLVDFHSAPQATGPSEPDPGDAATSPPWCDAGRELDAIHLAFHESGDTYPGSEVVDRGVVAAIEIAAADIGQLLAERQMLAQSLMQVRDEQATTVFTDPEAARSAQAVFDLIEQQCKPER